MVIDGGLSIRRRVPSNGVEVVWRQFVGIEIRLRTVRRDLRRRRCVSRHLISAAAAAVRRGFVSCQFGAHGVCRGLRTVRRPLRIRRRVSCGLIGVVQR